MRRIPAQAIKELRQFRRDPISVALSVIMPVVMILLFGLSISLDPDDLRLVVVDLDRTPLSREYIETFAASNKFDFLSWDVNRPADEALDNGTAEMALVIPPNFERDFKRGGRPKVQALIDGTDANTALLLRQSAHALTAAFNRQALGAAAPAPSVEVEMRFWYNPGLSDKRFFGAGALGVVLIFFPALLGGISTSREIELGTVIQVYASTLSPAEWILGKALPYIAIGIGELAVCFAVGAWAFEYRLPPDPTPFLAASLFYIAAGVLFGMLVGVVTGSQSAAIQAVLLVIFLMSLLFSGFLAPIENIPAGLRWISYFIPGRYYIWVIRDAFFRDGGWGPAWPHVAVLALLSVLVFAANLAWVRRMRFSD